MPHEDDLRWELVRSGEKRQLETLNADELAQLYQDYVCLTREQIFIDSGPDFEPHSYDFGVTHEGRERLVSATMRLAEKALV